jgi:hypothetical protein
VVLIAVLVLMMMVVSIVKFDDWGSDPWAARTVLAMRLMRSTVTVASVDLMLIMMDIAIVSLAVRRK